MKRLCFLASVLLFSFFTCDAELAEKVLKIEFIQNRLNYGLYPSNLDNALYRYKCDSSEKNLQVLLEQVAIEALFSAKLSFETTEKFILQLSAAHYDDSKSINSEIDLEEEKVKKDTFITSLPIVVDSKLYPFLGYCVLSHLFKSGDESGFEEIRKKCLYDNYLSPQSTEAFIKNLKKYLTNGPESLQNMTITKKQERSYKNENLRTFPSRVFDAVCMNQENNEACIYLQELIYDKIKEQNLGDGECIAINEKEALDIIEKFYVKGFPVAGKKESVALSEKTAFVLYKHLVLGSAEPLLDPMQEEKNKKQIHASSRWHPDVRAMADKVIDDKRNYSTAFLRVQTC